MFGSGDDKKTPQPAPRADTPETVDQAASESVAKPVKKGLFSWFSKKNAEPQTPEPLLSLQHRQLKPLNQRLLLSKYLQL